MDRTDTAEPGRSPRSLAFKSPWSLGKYCDLRQAWVHRVSKCVKHSKCGGRIWHDSQSRDRFGSFLLNLYRISGALPCASRIARASTQEAVPFRALPSSLGKTMTLSGVPPHSFLEPSSEAVLVSGEFSSAVVPFAAGLAASVLPSSGGADRMTDPPMRKMGLAG